MSKRPQVGVDRQAQQKRPKAKSTAVTNQKPIPAPGGSSIHAQAALLGDLRFQTAQRQATAMHIGQMRGNQYLQRVLAQTGGSAVIQRNEHDNAGDFIDWIQEQAVYKNHRYNKRMALGQCAPAAKEIGDFLKAQGFTTHYRAILVFGTRKTKRGKEIDNKNHYVVVATVAGANII